MVPVLVVVLLSLVPTAGEPTVNEITMAAYEAPAGAARSDALLAAAALAVEEQPREAVAALVAAVKGLELVNETRRGAIAGVLASLGAETPGDFATSAEWVEQVGPYALQALMRIDPSGCLALTAQLNTPEDAVVAMLACAATELASSGVAPQAPMGGGSVRPVSGEAAATAGDPLADRDRLVELALDLAADLDALEPSAAGLASAIADVLAVDPAQRPELDLPEESVARRERAALLAEDLADLASGMAEDIATRTRLLCDLLAAPPARPVAARTEESSIDEASSSGIMSASEMAQEAKARLGNLRAPEPALVDQVVAALFATDREAARRLIYEVGPTREPACALLCMEAETAGEALEAASGIASVGRRAQVLLERAGLAGRGELRRALVREAVALAELVGSPSEQAGILAQAAALEASGLDPAGLAEKARFAAVSTPDSQMRGRTLAQVASLVAPVAPELAEECFAEALQIATEGLRDAERARALRDVAVGAAAGMPHHALDIAGQLGGDRVRSRIDVLLAVTRSPHQAYQVEAANQLVDLVAQWDTAPLQKIGVLQEVAAALATASHRSPAPQPLATPSASADWVMLAITRPAVRIPDESATSPPPTEDSLPARVAQGRTRQNRFGDRDVPPDSASLPASPRRPLPPAGTVAEAKLRVEWWIARFSLERALSLPTGESRIAAFLQAAQALAPFDEALATEALVGALRDSALYDANFGWAERAHSLAETGGIPYAAAVASVLDPKVRARSLIAAGMTADEDIALIDDAWARAEIRVRAAAKDPGPDQVDEALVAVRALPPGTLRDGLAISLMDGIRGGNLTAVHGAAERLSLLASGPRVAAQIRLAGSQEAARRGNSDLAREWLGMAEELIAQAGATPSLLAERAVALDLLGEDGLALARAIDDPAARAQALVAIRFDRDAHSG